MGDKSTLFVGIALDGSQLEFLSNVSSVKRGHYIGDSDLKLSSFQFEGNHYLGKKRESPLSLDDLLLTQENIKSHLLSLFTQDSFESFSFVLIPTYDV